MSKITTIRIGSRTSKLALSQVAEFHLSLAQHFPHIKIEIIAITTSGDKIQDRNLAEIGGKGLFIKELEEALLQGKIDIAIHSAKDVPPQIHEKTILAAFSERMDARDCFVSKKYNSLKSLPKGAIIGTSSPRRKAILLNLRPDLKIVNFRGNVDTRLNKIENEEVDAAILAVCGLVRIAKENLIKEAIAKDKILPSGGQGSLAIQALKENNEILEILKKVNHQETEIAIKCERAFLTSLGASCTTPVAVHAQIVKDNLVLETAIIDYDGSEIYTTKSKSKINLEEAILLGCKAAEKTKKQAKKLLEKICK
jgi:hydroxymethylbilane synthase